MKSESRMTPLRRTSLLILGILSSLALSAQTPDALAVQGIPLAGSKIPQFVDPLPTLSVSAYQNPAINTLVAGTGEIQLDMCEFKSNVMPSTFVPATGAGTYTGTYTWGYIPGTACPSTLQETYIGPVIVATRDLPTQIRFANNLGFASTSNILAWNNSTDQTLHWADPLGNEMNMCAHSTVPGQTPVGNCALNYSGPIPAVPHLHGGEVPPVLDGGPEAWFTSDGSKHGSGYYSMAGAAANEAIYRYPNGMEAAPIWFHDHVLGITRLNVYAGLAGAYLVVDPLNPPPANLQGPAEIVPLVIQDRMFDVNGQLYFPNLGINPEHPYWVPEFVGDTIVVNGKVWPYLNVEAKRYRFLIINGSNARTYELSLPNGQTIWQIGTDGGYLDAPVGMKTLLIMPGERAEIIIDFAGLQGKTLTLKNTGRTPFPKGAPPRGSSLGQILQFRVGTAAVVDASYNPATGAALRTPMVRLVNPATGALATGVTANKTRQLTLNEIIGPGGPLEILVNNTKWDGLRADGSTRPDFTPITVGTLTNYYSEIPNEGDTEVWEIVNMTADAHPIHTHLTQFQLLNRQNFSANKYATAYAASFTGGLFIPAYGPPLNYNTGNTRALGGNPDITPYLLGGVMPPNPNEAGWKDTVVMYPGQVTRIAVRYAPMFKPINDPNLSYSFDPNANGQGYVWHCHIIDHEDNEMMRPYAVNPKPGALRSYILGTDY